MVSSDGKEGVHAADAEGKQELLRGQLAWQHLAIHHQECIPDAIQHGDESLWDCHPDCPFYRDFSREET